MKRLKILLYSDTIDFGLNTNTYQKFLNPIFESLRKNIDLEDCWIVANKIFHSDIHHKNTKIYNLYDFKNSKNIIDVIKPDLILLNSGEIISYSILLAAKYNEIQSVFIDSGFATFSSKSTKTRLIKSRFFQFYFIGNQFLKKYFFLLKTQLAIGQNFFHTCKTFLKIFNSYLTSNDRLEFRNYADLYICSNYDWFDNAIKNGVEKNKIIVAGEFALDYAYQKIKNFPNMSHKKTNVLFITTSTVEHGIWTSLMRENVVKIVVKTLSEFSNTIKLKIKIHPGENIETYKKIICSIDPSIEILKEEDLTLLVYESDLIITFGQSASLVEAIILKKPILQMNLYDESYSLIQEGISIECRDAITLKEQLITRNSLVLNPIKTQEFIEKKIHKFDGKCGERAANAILSLFNKKIINKT